MKTLSGKESLKSRIMEWADKLDVQIHSITVRPMRTKWASCSTSGRLTFEKALTAISPHLQDYVIVHELLHLRVPNHGKLWKSLMHAHLGEYERFEKEMKRTAQDRPSCRPQ
jgi:predicted metal-dependent hydrolase